jgi:hypothetical protein
MKQPNNILEYNIAQYAFIISQKKHTVLNFARGVGKSTIMSRRISDCVHQMPRSTGVIVGCTYAQIKTKTLPSTIKGLEMHGWIKGVHFLVGKRPPKSWGWPTPYEEPLDYKNSIIWYNGTIINLVSQDASASSGRGMNIDWYIADEAALLDYSKLEQEVITTNRSNLHSIAEYPDGTFQEYQYCSLHHSSLLVTSTPITLSGKWIFKFEEMALLKPDEYAFIKANSFVNEKHLGSDWLKMQKEQLTDFMYNAEILNKRVAQVTDGFYPKLNEDIHTYSSFSDKYYKNYTSGPVTCAGDTDLDNDRPLTIGVDWGANINCMVVCQDYGGEELKVLKNFYVKSPKIFDDIVDEQFARYYKPHGKKVIHLYYDPTGNLSTANSRKTYAEQIKETFQKHGWVVILRTTARTNKSHEDKYHLWNKILSGKESNMPKFSMNIHNCKELYISMINAPAKQGRNESIKKDKKSETSKKINQAHATHFSDALDVVVVGMYLDKSNGHHYGGLAIQSI